MNNKSFIYKFNHTQHFAKLWRKGQKKLDEHRKKNIYSDL